MLDRTCYCAVGNPETLWLLRSSSDLGSTFPRMDHRLKAAIQWGLSLVPGGTWMNNRLQNVRRMMPDWFLANKLAVAKEILDLRERNSRAMPALDRMKSLEIGAGWDLLLPLAMRGCGAEEIHCIDIFPHLDSKRIGNAVALLRKLDPDGCASRLPEWSAPSENGLLDHIQTAYGIRYAAPCDARRTDFEESSFDLFLSYHVMEHIPPQDLREIHRESFRLLKPGAVAIHYVDLQDHWAYATPRRSVHGFLGNGPTAWKCLNPPLHYQNRLRSKEHVDALASVGFEIAIRNETRATDEQLALLRRPGAVHGSFLSRGSIEELGVTYLVVVARKPG